MAQETPEVGQPERTQESQKPHESRDRGASREDYVLGTTHEGIVMEQDPLTGDRVIQVTPPPREEEENQEPPVLLIQPEINLPVR